MAHRKVRELMTADAVTVTLDTQFKELAGLIAIHEVSALPVLGPEGHVAGVVSEMDLLRKEQFQEDPGRTARDVMTAPAVTVTPDATIVEAARLMDRHRIKRLLVVDADGRLAGIITPRDLLRVYLRSADEIRAEIVDEVVASFPTNPDLVNVTVADGVVTLDGEVERKSMIPLAARMAYAVDGVVDVLNRLSFAIDDTDLDDLHR
ncbi:MAG TPA: CBS domain-containing protein [Streptosporangiaceae bacterium]|nr:CBS domain-containing protein [Streptosporangiaceae bacterium]